MLTMRRLALTDQKAYIFIAPPTSFSYQYQFPKPKIGSASVTRVSKEIAQEKLRFIIDHYVVPSDNVLNFLNENLELVMLLVEGYEALEAAFGPNPRVELELTTDPENGNGEELFGYVWTTLSADEALDALHQFDRNWFLDNLDRANGKLNFNVNFL